MTTCPQTDTAPAAPPDWRAEALCAQVGPDPFFLDKGGSLREARALCASCPVRATCLETAMEAERGCGLDRRFGIWGGLGPRERHRLGKRRAAG